MVISVSGKEKDDPRYKAYKRDRDAEEKLLYRFRDRPLFEREFHVLARERGLQVLWLPGRRRSPTSWLGANAGRVDDATALGHWVPDLAERDVYVCGPDAWADDVRRSALALGLPPERFHVESFGW